eukprot:TRINITY_DN51_c0_g1_i1.p1 TRINITY_DN51_c0_g1~~TRINITY_DN51_c0_g1_i1.p1  ORF type:complete len:206 (-),score=30.71 TRINITY_DN51_c0_g1_i1:374-955(-)
MAAETSCSATLMSFAEQIFSVSDPRSSSGNPFSFQTRAINAIDITHMNFKSKLVVPNFVYSFPMHENASWLPKDTQEMLRAASASAPPPDNLGPCTITLKKQTWGQKDVKPTDTEKEVYLKLTNRVRKHRKCRVVKEVREGTCSWCKTTKTPEWRTGPDNTTLCNACGLQFRTNKRKQEAIAKKRNAISNLLN